MHKTTDAAKILKAKLKNDPIRSEQFQSDLINAEVAQMIFKMRDDAKLSRTQFARKALCSATAIRQLEDAEFEGDSIAMLCTIAEALGLKLNPAEEGFSHVAARMEHIATHA